MYKGTHPSSPFARKNNLSRILPTKRLPLPNALLLMLQLLHTLQARSSSTQSAESDDCDTFSTPPSSPLTATSSISSFSDSMQNGDSHVKPLSRKNSRPTSLILDGSQPDWTSDVEVEAISPSEGGDKRPRDGPHLPPKTSQTSPMDSGRKPATVSVSDQSRLSSSDDSQQQQQQPRTPHAGTPTNLRRQMQNSHMESAQSGPNPTPMANPTQKRHEQHEQHQLPPKSPCFVHSLLDKGASLSDWLKTKQGMVQGVGVARSLEGAQPLSPKSIQNHKLPTNDLGFSYSSSGSSSPSDFDDEDDNTGSLTRQLAETAVGVREMSKQLGTFHCTALVS